MVIETGKFFFAQSLNSLSKSNWNECVGLDHPFTRYEFLHALESSASVSIKTGWKSFHYVELDIENTIIAVCPLYIKSHSFGEYIFDHAWADAYHRYGLNYYPKLQSAIPFTPVSGERIIIHHKIKDKMTKKIQVIKRIIEKTKSINVSSIHFNFLKHPEKMQDRIKELLVRQGIQFHWKNYNYKSFNDFLATLSSRKRKIIKKERQCINKYHLKIKLLKDNNINDEHWEFFYKCYLNTTGKKWGSSYLTKEFFLQIGRTFSDKIILIIAFQDNKMIASALNFISSTHLYGRHWGSLLDIPYLHFELCYYQAIDYAIENNIKIVEAGAQGEHKLQRGYMPEKTWSLHWIKNRQFNEAISNFLDEETNLMKKQKKDLEQFSPFKKY